jgi:hypothetical protein
MAQIRRRRPTWMPLHHGSLGTQRQGGGGGIGHTACICPLGCREPTTCARSSHHMPLPSPNHRARLATLTPHTSLTATRGVDEGPAATILVAPRVVSTIDFGGSTTRRWARRWWRRRLGFGRFPCCPSDRHRGPYPANPLILFSKFIKITSCQLKMRQGPNRPLNWWPFQIAAR